MCGTSQDALDLADVRFDFGSSVHFDVLNTQEIKLPDDLKTRLGSALHLSTFDFLQLDREVGYFFGKAVRDYIQATGSDACFVASHGVTSFHQPAQGITHQLGSGAALAAASGMPTITGFRELDVVLGGQGAPLVPYCDQQLFGSYEATLNLGGFANVSLLNSNTVVGFDVSPANLLLNHIASKLGASFDENGALARSGEIIPALKKAVDLLPYYQQLPPKSLGREWLLESVIPLFEGMNITPQDQLRTAVSHIAEQIGRVLQFKGRCLVTGGGAFNTFLVREIQHFSTTLLEVPDPELIAFKEAICFAFLGALRWKGLPNTAPSITGASQMTSGGYVHLPPLG